MTLGCCCVIQSCKCVSVGGLGSSEWSADGGRWLRWDNIFKNYRSIRPGRQHMEVSLFDFIFKMRKMSRFVKNVYWISLFKCLFICFEF